MAEVGLKRPRSSLLSLQEDPRETAEEELELHSYDDDEAQEWRETLQEEAKEQVKEDAELEANLSGCTRLEDLDERIKNVLTGITSKNPKEALVAFRQLLRGDDGGNLLHQYVLLSPKCTEITSVWSSEYGTEYAISLLQLLDELMKHPMGKVDDFQHTDPNRQVLQVVRVRIDKLARFIISTKLKDIYAHLTSGERSRQCAALHLLASIVKRGSMLASELATTFDFTLNVLPNLARTPKTRKREVKQSSCKWSTRAAFIDFAMSFLDVCHAALLRWVLQIRPLYGGVLHKLSSDDEITIISVLKVFQLKVLDASAMVPPGLQSALFGDSALEQMATISSDGQRSEAAQIAHDTLLQLCTEVSHGICPDPSLLWGASPGKAGIFGGGQGRLVRLMIKLKATEIQNHRDLLLSIAAKRPVLVATYFNFFPYSLEPRITNAWFAAAALISDIILVSKVVPPLEPLAAQGLPPPTIDSPLPQGILRSALPRTLTRLIINRGLLHANTLVKHGCLRMLSEVLSAGEFYLNAISKAQSFVQQKLKKRDSRLDAIMTKTGEGFAARVDMETLSFDSNSLYDKEHHSCKEPDAWQKWLAFERHFQDELRSVLPDPQVLFSLLSLKPIISDDLPGIKKRKSSAGAGFDEPTLDLEKGDVLADGADNLRGGFASLQERGESNLVDIWNADDVLIQTGDLKDVVGFFNAKLLEVLATYQRIMPASLVESSFDVFKLLPEDPVSLTLSQQKALLMLLVAASGDAHGQDVGCRSQLGCESLHLRYLYRHFKPMIKFTLGAKVGWIKQQSQFLARRAMFSCGAFESNRSEIGIWLQFLPLCDDMVLSFLCDAVETVGRNVDKYVETLLSIVHSASKQENTFAVPQFGPFVVCILDKCLRVLSSSSKNLKISQKTSVCIYATNALGLLLQSQVHPQVLSNVLDVLLSSRLDGLSSDIINFRSEWSPLQILLLRARWHLRRDEMPCTISGLFQLQTGCVANVLKVCNDDVTSSLEAKALALSACLQCAPPQELAENLPLLMEFFFSVFKGRLPVVVGLFGAYRWLLSAVSKLWPKLFKQALILASSLAHSKRGMEEKISLSQGRKLALSIHGIPDSSIKEDCLSAGFSDMTSFAFSVFLLGLPFAIIFPAVASVNEAELWGSPKLQSILEAALSEVSPGLWLCTSNLILYWVEDLWELHCNKGVTVEFQLEVCFSLLKSMILPSKRCGWFSLLETDEDASAELDLIAEFLGGVLTHPVMNVLFQAAERLSCTSPSDCVEEKTGVDESQVLERWFQRGACDISSLLGHTVVIFNELLQWASEQPKKDFSRAFEKGFQSVQRVVLFSCKPFLSEICCAVKTEQKPRYGVVPSISLYLAFTFSSYIAIDSVVELSCAFLSENLINEEANNWGPSSLSRPCHTIGLYFGTSAFNRVVTLRQQESLQYSLQQSMLQSLYQKVLHVVLKTPSELAFSCLLSALEADRSCKNISSNEWTHTLSAAVPFSYIYTTPLELVTHLMTDINKTKAKILLYLIQLSQCYLTEFAEALSCTLGVAPLVSGLLCPQPCHANGVYALKELILLLPSVNWLVIVTKRQKHMPYSKVVQQVLSVYCRAIVEILKDWDIFGTGLDMTEVLPFLESRKHYKQFSRYFGSTTSGQVVLMLKHCLAHHHFSTFEKCIFFSSMVEKSYPYFDLSVRNIDELSLEATLKLVSVITAKSMSAKMLFISDIHEANAGNEESIAEATDLEMEELSTKFSEVVNVLISTLCVLFEQKTSEGTDDKDKDDFLEVSGVQVNISKHKLLQLLERRLLKYLKSVLKATANVQFQVQHIPVLKTFTKSVLRFRFGESLPMQVLRLYTFKMVNVTDFSRWYAVYGLNLLVGHSQFASTLLSHGAYSRVNSVIGSYSANDSNLKSLSSILSLLKTPIKLSVMSKFMSEAESKVSCDPKLELLKFLRLLYFLKRQAAALDVSMQQTLYPSELLSLLLAAYGASLNKSDKENLLLMREMESFEGANFSGLIGMDYLWGEAALKWRQASMNVEYGSGAVRFSDEDTRREVRKRCFKEELPLDPTRCALGVVFFPMRRSTFRTSTLFGEGCEEEEEKLSVTESDERLLQDAAYDPCFMLPFALHSISSGWMDANEFVQKGLLALALMSTASAEEDMRKLGYEVLAKFLTVVEEGPSFKGRPQIRLLLIFVKNSVLEPWQRLPSVAALFAAEASCILMTPSDVHYPAVNKFLFRAVCLDLEIIPLFKPMFGSGSVYFRADRSWVLRLLAFSLRTSFDTHVYRRRFIMEILMSFYGSPLGDRHTREWILKILFRASKLRSFVQHLIEHCGLLSWLATIVCSNGTAKSGEYVGGISTELAFEAIQIFENALQWRSVKRWLISEGFEELSKMAMVLHYALVESSSFNESAVLVGPYLRILGTAFRFSQSRRKFQSRFNFSLSDFVALIQRVEMEKAISHETRMLALRTILESQPPACCLIQERNCLWKMGTWSLSLGLRDFYILPFSLEDNSNANVEESPTLMSNSKDLLATVFGWITTSLILGESHKGILQDPATAWTFFKGITRAENCGSASQSDVSKDLLRLLIHQQCLLGTAVTNASAICAVLLLLPSIEGPCGTFIRDFPEFLEWPLQKLSSPSELDASWRWRPFQVMATQSLFEYETCQTIFALFQKLLFAEEITELHEMMETLQLGLRSYGKRRDPCHSDHIVRSSEDLWKHLKELLKLPHNNVLGTTECGMET